MAAIMAATGQGQRAQDVGVKSEQTENNMQPLSDFSLWTCSY